MVLFWSWQSDIDKKISKNFIEKCIKKAVSEINLEIKIEDAIRLDQDTKGELGIPDIVETIFKKIESSNVFIADITPVAKTLEGKKIMNPNVAIETGYAIKELGYKNIITVMNSEFGDHDDLTFDLRGKRGPIFYKLSDTTTEQDKKQTEKNLVNELKVIFKKYFEENQNNRSKDLSLENYKFGVFFDKDTPIFSREGDSWEGDKEDIFFAGDLDLDSYIYFKVDLLGTHEEFKKKDLKDAIFKQGDPYYQITPIGPSCRWHPEINTFGAIVVSDCESGVSDLVQFFKDGSIIGISTSLTENSLANLNYLKRELERSILQSFKIIKERLNYNEKVNVEIGLINRNRLYFIPPKPPHGLVYTTTKFGPLNDPSYIVSKEFDLKTDNLDTHKFLLNFIDLILDDSILERSAEEHVWD